MEEILRDVNYGFQRRRENESLAWNLMRSAFERHANTLESLSMAITQTALPQHGGQGQEEDQITQTELLRHSRQFYNHDTTCVALLFLNAQYQHNVTEAIAGTLIQDTLQIIELLDPESIKYGGPEVVNISHKVAQLACQEGQPSLLIRPLIKLSLKVCPNHTHLNSIDADILQVAISAHMYSVALNYLSRYQFNQLEPNDFPINTVDILRFFYYSGIVYISSKQFQKALESFDQVLAIPAHNISTVAIEAYRKAVLVKLIYHGNKYQIPNYASNVMSRIHKQSEPYSSALYQNICDEFISDNYSALISLLNEEQTKHQLSADGNLGLTKQVIESFFLSRIVKLSSIYSTITLERILRYVNKNISESDQRYHNVHEIEVKLRELFLQKRIYGFIDHSNNMVTFLSERDGRARLNEHEPDTLETLQENMKTAMSTYSSLHLMQQDVVQSNKLIGIVLNNHLSSAGGPGSSIRDSSDFD